MRSPRDLLLARRAKQHGANYSLRIIWEARRAGIPISLGFAIIEQESSFTSVWGSDDVDSIPVSLRGKPVTKRDYLAYKAVRQKKGCQGVGPTQLTYYSYQDEADALGKRFGQGCWTPKYNIRVGFSLMARLRKGAQSELEAFAKYNGSGRQADKYAKELRAKQQAWHVRLS